MRRSYNDLTLEVFELIKSRPTHCFSINEVSKEVKLTWRTSRNILTLLKNLGIIRRVVLKKRELWLMQSSNNCTTKEGE